MNTKDLLSAGNRELLQQVSEKMIQHMRAVSNSTQRMNPVIVQHAVQLKAKGCTYRQIAQWLDDRGFRTVRECRYTETSGAYNFPHVQNLFRQAKRDFEQL